METSSYADMFVLVQLYKEPGCNGVILVFRKEDPTPPTGPTCNNPAILAEKRFYKVVCY